MVELEQTCNQVDVYYNSDLLLLTVQMSCETCKGELCIEPYILREIRTTLTYNLFFTCTLCIFTTYACTLFFLFFYALNFVTEFLLYTQKIAGLNPNQQTNCPDQFCGTLKTDFMFFEPILSSILHTFLPVLPEPPQEQCLFAVTHICAFYPVPQLYVLIRYQLASLLLF